jgi:hypothetical protein
VSESRESRERERSPSSSAQNLSFSPLSFQKQRNYSAAANHGTDHPTKNGKFRFIGIKTIRAFCVLRTNELKKRQRRARSVCFRKLLAKERARARFCESISKTRIDKSKVSELMISKRKTLFVYRSMKNTQRSD